MAACRWAASRLTAESGLSMAGTLAPAAPAASCSPPTAAATASSSSSPSSSSLSAASLPLLLLAAAGCRVYAASRATPASVTSVQRDRSSRLHSKQPSGRQAGLGEQRRHHGSAF